MSLTPEDLKKLKEPFDERTICVKAQSRSKNKDKISLILYVQHTDSYTRAEEVDPSWSSEITGEQYFQGAEPKDDWFSVRVKVTIKGVSRENSGEGSDKKSATSDGTKRALMLFGIGRYLYDCDPVWVPYNEQTDYYRTYTLSDYMAALRPGQMRPPIKGNVPSASAPQTQAAPPAQTQTPPASRGGARSTATRSAPSKPMIATVDGKTREQLTVEVMASSKELNMPRKDLEEYILDEMKKPAQQLSIAELQTLLDKLNNEIFMINARNQD